MSGSPDVRERLLIAIEEDVDRLARALEGFGRPVADAKMAVRPASSTVRDIVDVALAQITTLGRDHRFEFEEIGLPSTVEGEGAVLAHALALLLKNAVTFSRPGTRILISSERQEDHQLRLEVIDEGPGIPIEWRDRVFEPFFRIQALDAIPVAGEGLGLFIARQLIASQGGRTWIESPTSGQGTCVVVLLRVLEA
jgi:signal transduction histidine kinase